MRSQSSLACKLVCGPLSLWQHTCSVVLCLGGMLTQVPLDHTVSAVMEPVQGAGWLQFAPVSQSWRPGGGAQGLCGLHSQCRLPECGIWKSGQGGASLAVSLASGHYGHLGPLGEVVCHSLQGRGSHPSGVRASQGLIVSDQGGGPGQSECWCGCAPGLCCCPLQDGVGSVPGFFKFFKKSDREKEREESNSTYI